MERTSSGRLGPEETQEVLRRAAELDRDHAAAAVPALRRAAESEVGLDAEDLERIAAEAGLSREAVRRAVAELEAGKLDRPAPATGLKRLVAGEPTETERALDVPTAVAAPRLERLLRGKGLEAVGRQPDATRWEPRMGLRHSLGRLVNQGGTGVFIGSAVESSVWPAPNGTSRVFLRGDSNGVLASIAIVVGLLLAAPAGIAFLVVLGLGVRWGFGGQHLLGFLLVAAAWTALTAAISRGLARKRVRKLRLALERTLEELAAPKDERQLH